MVMLLFNLYGPQSPQKLLLFALALFAISFFSVTRRSRSDSVSESVSQSLTLRTELTDVTLVSEDTY